MLTRPVPALLLIALLAGCRAAPDPRPAADPAFERYQGAPLSVSVGLYQPGNRQAQAARVIAREQLLSNAALRVPVGADVEDDARVMIGTRVEQRPGGDTLEVTVEVAPRAGDHQYLLGRAPLASSSPDDLRAAAREALSGLWPELMGHLGTIAATR